MRLRSRLAGLALLTLALCALLALPAGAAGETYTTTVLFTHDLHSHFLPQSDGEGGETGGLRPADDRPGAGAGPAPGRPDPGRRGFLHRLPDPGAVHHPGPRAAHHGGHGL